MITLYVRDQKLKPLSIQVTPQAEYILRGLKKRTGHTYKELVSDIIIQSYAPTRLITVVDEEEESI